MGFKPRKVLPIGWDGTKLANGDRLKKLKNYHPTDPPRYNFTDTHQERQVRMVDNQIETGEGGNDVRVPEDFTVPYFWMGRDVLTNEYKTTNNQDEKDVMLHAFVAEIYKFDRAFHDENDDKWKPYYCPLLKEVYPAIISGIKAGSEKYPGGFGDYWYGRDGQIETMKATCGF